MSKKSDVEVEIEDLISKKVSLHWLHKESQRIAIKIMGQYPNTWKEEIKKMYTYTAVCKLIEIKRKEK
jgi:hypothetical protein